MLKRVIIALAFLAPGFFIGLQVSQNFAESRLSQVAIQGSIWFCLSIIVVALHRKYPRLFGFDDRAPLPRLDIALAVILAAASAYGAVAAVLLIDSTLAEPAILAIVAVAGVIGWLFRDKNASAKQSEPVTQVQSAQSDAMPRIRLDLACAIIGMAALNATYFSVIIADPSLFLAAMIGNILVFATLAWLARDKRVDRAEMTNDVDQ